MSNSIIPLASVYPVESINTLVLRHGHTAVAEQSEQQQETPDKKVPTLCFYATPGAVTIESDAEWQQENIARHETCWVGPGIHFLQQENPQAWGRHMRDWYIRISKEQP